MLLEISQNSQENTSARVSFLIKLQTAPVVVLDLVLANVFDYHLDCFGIYPIYLGGDWRYFIYNLCIIIRLTLAMLI